MNEFNYASPTALVYAELYRFTSSLCTAAQCPLCGDVLMCIICNVKAPFLLSEQFNVIFCKSVSQKCVDSFSS